jgi:hypothetical protein
MAKKAVVAKKIEGAATSDKTKNLVEAIVTVRSLQDFIKDRGGLEAALGTVARVGDLVALTGGFAELKEALEIVGREGAPPQA